MLGFESPKSLTATVYVRFHYKEREPEPVSPGETEMVHRILDRASELNPEMQEVLLKFADYLKRLGEEEAKP